MWKFHFIIIQYGKADTELSIPNWLDYELYTSKQIIKILGPKSYIFSLNSKYCKSFGYLVSKKKYIYTFDASSIPIGNTILEHLKNLITPSLPFMSHMEYNPFDINIPINKFNYGYPMELRNGVSTVISNGGVINVLEERIVSTNATYTIPKGSLYLMSDVNLVRYF